MSNEQLPNNHQAQNTGEDLNLPTSPNQPIPQNNVTQPSSPRRFKALKIILGITSLWPIIFFITYLLISLSPLLIGGCELETPRSALSCTLEKIFPLLDKIFYYPTIILGIIMSFLFIMLTFINKKFSKYQKTIFVVIFFAEFFITTPLIAIPIIYMPLYWYFYIWKEPKQNH